MYNATVTFYENDRNVDTITSVSRLQNSIDFAFPSDGNKPSYDYLNSVRLTFPTLKGEKIILLRRSSTRFFFLPPGFDDLIRRSTNFNILACSIRPKRISV